VQEDKNIKFPQYPGCFVCGQENPAGLRTRFKPLDKGAVGEYIPRQTHIGYENIIHGGIISSLLDEAVVWASFVFSGNLGVTAELTVKFLHPMVIGKTYTVTGLGKKSKGPLTLAESKIEDENGKIYARATGKVVAADV